MDREVDVWRFLTQARGKKGLGPYRTRNSRCGFTGQAIAGKISIYVQAELEMFWVIFYGSDQTVMGCRVDILNEP